jgi:arabinogalactan endo-1,4-beta-galactosidase
MTVFVEIRPRLLAAALVVSALLALPVAAQPTPEMAAKLRALPFQIGADISWIPEDEALGAAYFVGDQKTDIVQILQQHGFNSVRLRIFVDPHAPGGYSARRDEAFCDLAHTIAMAKRIKAAGMSFYLDFHYSDNWADPGKQTKPAAWAKLPFDDLKTAVHDFTRDTLLALRQAGVFPDIVSVGNEISNGMLWPDGQVDTLTGEGHWDQLAGLLKAGIAGAREVDPLLPIALHHHLGRRNDAMRIWLDHLIERDVQFDIIASSNYAQARDGDWKNNLDDLVTRYPGYFFVCAEYSRVKRYVNDLFFHLPDRRGLGAYIWEPERHFESIFESQWGGKNYVAPSRGGRAGGAQGGVAAPTGSTPATRGPTSAALNLADSGTNANEGATGAFLGQPAPVVERQSPSAPPPVPAVTATSATSPTPGATGVSQNGAAGGRGLSSRGGGRYIANDLLDLYPDMAKAYRR